MENQYKINKKYFYASFVFLLVVFFLFFSTEIFSFFTLIFSGIYNFAYLIFSNTAGLTSIVIRVWYLFLYGFGVRKRHKPWGVVFDNFTKEPLVGVKLTLLDIDQNIVGISYTDLDGRYGFLVEPGHYHITAEKKDFFFPSSKMKISNSDEVYNDLYYGNFIEIKNTGEVITKNIPMDRKVSVPYNFLERNSKKYRFFHRSDKAIGQIIDIAFYVGFLSAFVTLLGHSRDLFSIIVFLIYLMMFFVNRMHFGRYKKGNVFFSGLNLHLSYGLLHLYSREDGREVALKVIDGMGQYFCLAPNGTYNLSIDKKNADGSYSPIYEEENVEITKGYLNKDFIV